MKISSRARKTVAGGALVLAGMGVGGAVAVTGAASADTTAPSAGSSSTSSSDPTTQSDPSQPQRSDEQLLTGDKLDKVTAAAMAEYPGATIQRVETDSDGVYEAHVVTSAGDQLIVQVGEDYSVTGTQAFGGHDGDGPGA